MPPSMPPPPPPGAPYGASGSPYGGMPRPHPQGTTILVLGILSLVICGMLGPVAWVMGNNALAEIDQYPSAYSNRGSVQAGRICGIIATVLMIVGVILFILLAAAGD